MVGAAKPQSADGSSVSAVFERFTDRARRVIVLAGEEARLLSHNWIGTEHILLGLIHEGEGVAATALESLGVDLDRVRSIVRELVGPSAQTAVGSPPFTPRAKKVLELALREALGLGHNYIGTEHLLLALVREGEGAGAQALGASGVTRVLVRREVLQLLAGPTGADRLIREEPHAEPRCQHCGAELVGGVRSRRLLAPDDEGGPAAATIVVYCSSCGRGVGAHIATGTRAPPAG